MQLTSIAKIRSSYSRENPAPRQGYLSEEESSILVNPEFVEAMKDVKVGDYLQVLYWALQKKENWMISYPPKLQRPVGVFSTRSPVRLNPINVSIVKVVRIEDNEIFVTGLEAFDQSDVIDIKGYSEQFHENLLKNSPSIE